MGEIIIGIITVVIIMKVAPVIEDIFYSIKDKK